MDAEIKKTVRAGNSSAVILPRAWLDQEGRVELVKKTPEKILYETLSIASKHVALEEIIGIYLAGSYARGEEDRKSDIDILIITSDVDKEMIHEGIYNVLIVSDSLLKWKLENDILPIGPMLKEAVALLNSSYLDSIKIKVTKKNVKWYIETTRDKLEIIKKAMGKMNGNIDNRVAYSLVLRIRTLHLIQKLIREKKYSKKEFMKLIDKISGSSKAYLAYLAVKNNMEEKAMTSKEEARKLCVYLENQLDEARKLIK